MPEKQEKKENNLKEEIVTTPSGTYIFPNGDKYDGEYNHLENGTIIRSGYGEHISIDGMICRGEWIDDKLNGKGTVIHPSGAMYEGDMENNMMHGSGRYTFPDRSVYEGEFCENRLIGNGSLKDKDGQLWCGEFDNKTAIGLQFKLRM